MKFRWIRGLLVVCLIFLVAVTSFLVYAWTSSGRVVQRTVNPTGNVIAEVIDGEFAAATDVGSLNVILKTKFNPVRHYVFGGSNYGAQIRISWIGPNVLLIRCQHCEKLQGGNILEQKWHQVTICYDQSDAIELPRDQDASCPKEPTPMTPEPHL